MIGPTALPANRAAFIKPITFPFRSDANKEMISGKTAAIRRSEPDARRKTPEIRTNGKKGLQEPRAPRSR